MALLPPFYLDAVVALEVGPDEQGNYRAVASGVLVGFDTLAVADDGSKLYRIALVTSKHVVRDKAHLQAKFNKGDAAARYQIGLLDEAGGPMWRTHEDFDIAVMGLNVDVLRDGGAQFTFITEDNIAYVDRMKELGVAAGDDVYILGFPLGLAGTARKYGVVRSGTIARLDDEVIGDRNAYWIDAPVYPGNSGGPAVLRPSLHAIEGTSAISQAYLIGIVASYIPYIDTAVSQQTQRARITFEENSGLADVVPMDAVKAAFAPFMPPPPEAPKMEPGEVATTEATGQDAANG